LVEPGHPQLSLRRQCALLGLTRSSLYYQPVDDSPETVQLMRLLDEQYTATPFYGVRRMTAWLHHQGYEVNHYNWPHKLDHMLRWKTGYNLEHVEGQLDVQKTPAA